MRITSIAVANLRRRKAKAMFLVTGIGIGIGTVVAILSLSGSIRQEIGAQLDRFGANIVVVPNTHSLSLDYGGISVSGVSFDAHQLTNDDAAKILNIPYRKRLSIVAPKLLTAADVDGRQALLAGVQFREELRLKHGGGFTARRPKPRTKSWWVTRRRGCSTSSRPPRQIAFVRTAIPITRMAAR